VATKDVYGWFLIFLAWVRETRTCCTVEVGFKRKEPR